MFMENTILSRNPSLGPTLTDLEACFTGMKLITQASEFLIFFLYLHSVLI
jgi:hypothetical protein